CRNAFMHNKLCPFFQSKFQLWPEVCCCVYPICSNMRLEFIMMNPAKYVVFLILLSLAAVILWAYWFVLGATVERWPSAEYSHGYFVPLFAFVLLWLGR